jgi:hypothetical protein
VGCRVWGDHITVHEQYDTCKIRQAWAELCQAQVQLRLDMLAVTRKKLMAYLLHCRFDGLVWLSSKTRVLITHFWPFSISKEIKVIVNIKVAFHLPNN